MGVQHVYCFIDPEERLFKIGFSNDPMSRHNEICRALGRQIAVSFYYDCENSGGMTEADFKSLFAEYRTRHPHPGKWGGHTEWFRFPPKGSLQYLILHSLDACFAAARPHEKTGGICLRQAFPWAA